MGKLNRDKVFGIVNTLLLLVITFLILYPLYFTIIASVSEPSEVVGGKVVFWPKGFSLDSYKAVFKEKSIWSGYRNSILYTLLGTLLNLILTIPAAYALSKKNMRFRRVINTYFVFTMFFSGGMLPGYLLVKDLGLINKPYTLIVLGGLSVYNVIVARTYFMSSIPESIYEAAEIDGCSEFGKYFKIAIPLAKPIIAVITLYYAVGRWNDYFTSLIFISDSDYFPLQLVLRNILQGSQVKLSAMDTSSMASEELLYLIKQANLAEAMKYAVIFIASLPMLIIYPFIQKYFVKGVMVGSVKG